MKKYLFRDALQSKQRLSALTIRVAFFNLFVIAVLGLLLRAIPLLDTFPLGYKNLLHGHSHFAFGGWVLPVLIALVMKVFPDLSEQISFLHWRNIIILALVSDYGMLIFFPIYGYKGINIFFSTVSLAATVYFAVVLWKGMKNVQQHISHRFLCWGLIYATLSSVGPFATVPLILKGQQGTTLYFDLIYLYLHFQYNGFFTFTILALLYRRLDPTKSSPASNTAFLLLNLACIPAYALSVLWHKPSYIFNLIGIGAAGLQLAAGYFLWVEMLQKKLSLFRKLCLAAFTVKLLLQFAGGFPSIALIAYENHNLLIAYLHLVLLGFVSLFVFDYILSEMKKPRLMVAGLCFFLFSFLTTEFILLSQSLSLFLNLPLHFFQRTLFLFSLPFPVGTLLMAVSVWQQYRLTYKSFLLKERSERISGTAIHTNITPSV